MLAAHSSLSSGATGCALHPVPRPLRSASWHRSSVGAVTVLAQQAGRAQQAAREGQATVAAGVGGDPLGPRGTRPGGGLEVANAGVGSLLVQARLAVAEASSLAGSGAVTALRLMLGYRLWFP